MEVHGPVTTEPVSHSHFEAHLDEAFAVADLPIELVLIEVTAMPSSGAASADGRVPFSLLFRGPAEPVMPQRTYRLSRGGGEWDIFLVPIGPDAHGMRYEAVYA